MKRRLGLGLGALLALPFALWGALEWLVTPPSGERLPLPPDAISFDSEAGRALLVSSGSVDHEALAASYQSQEKTSWCGVASAVTVLGARGRALSQSEAVRDRLLTTIRGMTLAQLAELFASHGAVPELHHAEHESLEAWRAELARNARSERDWLVVNYDRRALGEQGEGHISPVSAYDPVSDRVLLLDPSSYKYPPHWVPAEALFRAMSTLDTSSGRSRGWVVVR